MLVKLTWLEGQTWRDLQKAMRTGLWHIFHFIGHGAFDRRVDEGALALVGDDGQTYLIHATEVSRLLANHGTLRLVILNACEGAKGGQRDLFSSTAATLAQRGIPAVLAMQYEISDRVAIELTSSFYESLADGLPVDAALTEARTTISLGVNNSLEWGTPVLFLRAPDSVLFDMTAKPLTPPIVAPPAPAPAAPPVTPPAAPQKTKEETSLLGGLFGRFQKTKEEWMKEGDAHQQAKRYGKALAAYEQAIRLDPNYAAAWNGKGTGLLDLKRYKEAASAYQRAIQLDPTERMPYNGAEKALALETLDLAEELIWRRPTQGNGYYFKGGALKRLGRTAEAEEAFKKARDLGYTE